MHPGQISLSHFTLKMLCIIFDKVIKPIAVRPHPSMLKVLLSKYGTMESGLNFSPLQSAGILL